MKKHAAPIALAVLSAMLAPSLSAQAPQANTPKIYWQEDFRNYSDKAPGVSGENMEVGNDPIWSVSAELNVRSKKNVQVFDKDISAPELKNFDLSFRYRFMNAKPPVAAAPEVKDKNGKVIKPAVSAAQGFVPSFDIVLKTADGTPQVITVKPDSVILFGKATQTDRFLSNWKWEDLAIRADGKTVKVYLSVDRELKEIASAPFSGVLKAFNLTAKSGEDFAVSSFMLTDYGPLKAYPVEKHFADFRSRTQAIPGAKQSTPGQTVSLTPAPYAGIRLQTGNAPNAVAMTLNWSDGTKDTIEIQAINETRGAAVPVAGKNKLEQLVLSDAILSFGKNGALARQYVRPHLKMYQSSYDAEPQYIDIVREWNRLPSASQHPLAIDFVQSKEGLDMYFDASFIKKFSKKGATVKTVEFKFNSDKSTFALTSDRYKNLPSKYYLLDFSANPRAKAFADAKLSLKPGFQNIDGIPFDIAKPMDSADVAICKQGKGNWALEVEEYHGRSPLDGFPSAVHFRLPPGPYGKAWVLFALDPDPKKDKILTTRVAHYIHNGSGGNMLADNVIDLNGVKEMPKQFKQVGTVTKNGAAIPLYLAEIPLALGEIVDIPARMGWIDFEFTGKGWVNMEQLDNTMKPDPESDSAFNIFAVTLEKAPVIMDIRQKQPGNVFTEDEANPGTFVIVKADSDNASGTVSWSASDVDGQEVFKGSKAFNLAKQGDKTEIEIPFQKTPVGYYDLNIRISDAKGTVLFSHPARFAILGKDLRKADKFKSPYAVWWFNVHGSPGDISLGGPILQKAGIRKASWNNIPKEAQEKYNITNCGNIMAPGTREFDGNAKKFRDVQTQIPDPNDPKKKISKTIPGKEFAKNKILEQLKNNPSADHILIWHETAPGYGIPEELLHLPVPESTDWDKTLAAYINAIGPLIREANPKLKIQLGNSSASIGAAVRPLRAGADPQYYDYMGIETPSQVIPPERLSEVGLQGMVITRDIANLLAKGKKDVKLNGCWEFTYRCERDMGEQQQAEWYMRDVLISLANDFFLISPGILFDCSNGYYNGLWGGSGLLLRGPFVYPKRAYVAYAALTNALDRVSFSRQFDTGSTTVYALEFKREDGKFATALWSARGDVKFKLDNPSGSASVTEMYGKTTTVKGNDPVIDGGTAPVYVLTDKPLKGVSIVGRSFKKDEALAAKGKVAPAMSAAEATIVPDPVMESTHTGFLPILKPGTFTMKQVDDAEKGPCIEVTLDTATDPYKSKYITEYSTVRFKEPIPVPGNPEVIGVWVNGNSNWGQVRFEIEDAKGEVFRNLSTGRMWGCDIMDWPGNLAVSFDGWGFVYTPLFPTKLVNDHSPGPESEQWVSAGGDKKIDLPIKVRAITVGMNRHKLDLLDFKKAAPSVRLFGITGIEK